MFDDPGSRHPLPDTAGQGSVDLDRALTGTLPCITCRYDLKGLSIRGTCPECGTAVRATILWQVDPMAEEFRPVRAPRLLAWSVVVWSFAALASALCVLAIRATELIGQELLRRPDLATISQAVVGFVVLSGVAIIPIISPVRGTKLSHVASGCAALLAYIPLALALWTIHVSIDPMRATPYFSGFPSEERLLARLVASASMIVIILGIRPSARDLVRRSLVLRTGRVDRQTLLVMAAVIALSMVGDGLRLAAAGAGMPESSLSAVLGTLIIALSSGLFTLGLIGAAFDSWRIRKAILIPSPSLKQVLGTHEPAA